MKKIHAKSRFCTSLLTAFIFFPFVVHSQAELNKSRILETPTNILLEVLCYDSETPLKSNVNVYVQIPYSEITFVKEEDRYIGRLELSAAVLDSGKQIWSKTQTVELDNKDFAQTVSSRRYTMKQFLIELSPGNYQFTIQITDEETKHSIKMNRSVSVPKFRSRVLSVSDLMLASKTYSEGAKTNIAPNLTGKIMQDDNNVSIFFEVYSQAPIDSINLIARFVNSKNEEILRLTKGEHLTGNRTQVVWKLGNVPTDIDRYVFSVEARGIGKDSLKYSSSGSSRIVFVQLYGLPATITDIDKAVEQLLYVAKQFEIDAMLDAKSQEEKRRLFLEFWAKRDPDPRTQHNELMEEYYERVEFANKNYTRYMDGWKTDRGMVYIRFGPPENIERHPFNSDSKPYEIWYYYRQNREFVFVDETGFDDYHLQYPSTDLWGRIR